jgi:putative ABC transport system substrate-binding protein
MDRRAFLTGSLGLLAAPLAAEAQQPARVFRIGVLAYSPPTVSTVSPLREALLQGLRALGYVEGQNLAIEWRYWEGKPERLPALAAELVRLKVEVIVVGPTPAAEEAKRATSTIPIVALHGDPVGSGLVASLARPGGNVTGLSVLNTELLGKQLQLLTEVLPRLSRVAVLSNPTTSTHRDYLREAGGAARSLNVQLQILEARAPSEFAGVLSAATTAGAGALVALGDSMFFVQRTRLAELAAKSRLPLMAPQRDWADSPGCLMAYGVSVLDTYRRLAIYIDKILRGAKPADLPVEQPTKFELVINLKTAKALGLTIPPSVLVRADQIIE